MNRHAIIAALALGLAACSSDREVTPVGEDLTLRAETVLPPGQSGFISVEGQAAGLLTGDPGDYGEHVDDQRFLYWNFAAKPAGLGSKPGAPSTPKDGVEIYRDAFGVPIVYASTVRDLWFGAGYAIAQDRLFLMDAVRRFGRGTFGELAGCGSIPADVKQRTIAYSDAEYDAMLERLSPDARDAVLGYVDGANAWRVHVLTSPLELPAEYGLLTTFPEPFTTRDVLAAGVFITRFVASEGGNEFQNLAMIRALDSHYGSRAAALDAFRDMTWLDDPEAATTVPREEGTFANQDQPAEGRDAVFERMAAWALELPASLAEGPGTGRSSAPFPCTAPSAPTEIGSCPASGSGAGAEPSADSSSRISATVVAALEGLRASLRGGSYAFAIGSSRTRDAGTLLVSGPQLGYSYPALLVELEIHGAGYDARGVSVPILPVVGIGYTEHAAWGLTTGYSKTIDSFIETVCSNAAAAAGTCEANQYLHDGQWKDMSCRTETFAYRAAAEGIPAGPPILTTSAEICRTVHGPIVARDDDAGLARSVQYAMAGRETESIEGIREWNRARSFDEFVAGVEKVTWNENVTVATRDGHIAFFHPGLFPRRPAASDPRLPLPGTGDLDLGENLEFDDLPHAVDPAQGFLANWNTKPAHGWLDGEGLGATSRPAGRGQRVTSLRDHLATRTDWTFADLQSIDEHGGTTDPRAREYLPVVQAFRDSLGDSLDEVERAALDRMLAWDRRHYAADIDPADADARDTPGATIFGAYVAALRDEIFGSLREAVVGPSAPRTVFDRLAGVGSHLFDHAVIDNLVLRILEPSSSALALRRDYTGGRSRDQVMAAALDVALERLADELNGGAPLTVADLENTRRIHPRREICSLTGVIGPGSDTLPGTSRVSMPYQDRGSWVHRAGFEHGANSSLAEPTPPA